MVKVAKGDKNRRYILCFFPFAGIATGAVMYGFCMLCQEFGLGQSFYAFVGALIPVLMSGIFPLIGFMNTADILFLSRFQDIKAEYGRGVREGAFASIMMAAYFLLYAGGLVLIWKERQLLLLGVGYILSRTLYVMAFLWFPEGINAGVFLPFLSKSQRQMLRVIFSIILALCFCTCIAISPIIGALEILLSMWLWTYYYYMSKKRFGGVTVASSGYFRTLCELAIVLFIGIFGRIFL